MESKFESEKELIEKIETIIGHRIGEYDVQEKLKNKRNKGNIGHVIEQGFFGYDINNNPEADFAELGIELKVTGYKWVRNDKQVSAKERLVISMIDFFNDINVDFYDSGCFNKIAKMLLVLYEYDLNKEEYDFIITNYYMYDYHTISEKDKIIIEGDWETIMNKIREGKAHELSEGDTYYLGACPKGSTKESVTKQPFSDEMAMKRAYSLKTTYMTNLFRTQIFHEVESREAFIKDISRIRHTSLTDFIYETFNAYKNKSLSELDKIWGVKVPRKGNKQYIRSYVSRMMKIDENNLNTIEEFEKANIQIKTIRINKQGKIKESMSFPSFDFIEVAEEEWENSTLREMFSSTKFLFVIFDEIDDDKLEYKFREVKLWNMPISTIERQIKKVWEETNRVLNNDLIIEIKNNRVLNNFPKARENCVAHVRPHARNRDETRPLPQNCHLKVQVTDGSVNIDRFIHDHEFTKQCFWLNSKYVDKIINDL